MAVVGSGVTSCEIVSRGLRGGTKAIQEIPQNIRSPLRELKREPLQYEQRHHLLDLDARH